MKEKIRVSFVATYFILLAFLIIIFLKQVKAQTITTPNNTEEKVEIQNVENLQKNENDTLKIKQDSLTIQDNIIYGDSLHITSIDSIISDTVSAEFISSVSPISSGSPDREENYTTAIDSTHSCFIPSLFKKKLSHNCINYDDSNAVFTYLYHKEFPPYIIDYHFLIDRLYSFSEEIDIVENSALINIRFGKAEIISPFSVPLEKFWELKLWKKFQESFYNELLQSKLGGEQARELEGIIPDIEFPKIKMPGAMRRFFGDNIGRLRVTGSQKITIGGTRTTKKPRLDTESTRRSILPDLNMKQDLNLGISGTIGDKIKVDVKQTSEESIFKKNKISIKYEGDEDDPIKLIEGGDTRLSLSGSHFISYSASSEDLFGLKGNFEFGKLKLTTIVGQQEGQHASASATGTSMEDFTEYRDMDFARNKYFFIGSPDVTNPNTIFHEEDGKLVPIDSLMPQEGTVRVFVDDRKMDTEDKDGYSIDDQGHEVKYKFQEYLFSTDDFFIDYINSPHIIELNKYIGDDYIIGLIYEDRSGQTYGHDYGDSLEVKLIKGDYTNVSPDDLAEGGALWDYQLKNIYSLGGRNIEKQGFEVNIYRYLSNGEKEEGITDTTTTPTTYTPFIKILNLDINGDGRVDDIDGTVDFEKGIIMFPMLEPFRSEWFAEYDATLGNDIIYEKLHPDPTDDYFEPFRISVKMKKTAGQINLGHINIIKNSEKVYIDGVQKKRDIDYEIDYTSGTVTLLGDAALDPNVPVRVNFEYEPLFALDKKNMFGMRADYEFNKNAKLGATVMYEAGSVKGERPKVGSEPKKILVGDIDGQISMNLPFITELVDRMPIIKTNEKSSFSLSGEMAMNIPNPNATDKQEAYIDDMEGVVESYSLGIGRTDWTFASFPLGIEPEDSSRGDLQWYNPYHKFQAKDIYQDLTEREGRENVSVLEMKLQSNTTLFPNSEPPIWSGIMKAFGTTSVDFSKKKYLELTMKSEANPGDTLFIDLGFISEDYYPILNPNDKLDEEDGCVNGIKDGELDIGEDIGLDRVKGKDPTPAKNHAQDGTPEIDDGNDDYYYDPGSNDYDKINGMEGNKHLDTEDLNRNGDLDRTNNYLQYAIDLSSLDINSEIVISESENKEWKFIRIPLQDSTYFTKEGVGTVSFSQIKYARIWAKSDSSSLLTIDIAAIDVVGNKWKASAILDTTLHTPDNLVPNEEFEIATDNNKKNPDYTPPPGSIDKREEKRTKEKQIEQSIFLDCSNIQPNRYLYARQNFVDAVNLLLYDKVKFWVYGQTVDSTETNKEIIIFRLGTDTLNYYEFRKEIGLYEDIEDKMLEKRWQEISIDFVDFSGLKKSDIPDTNECFRIIGNPSLGHIKQVVVGLLRPDSLTTNFTGNIYFDDIRVANPCDEMGVASRISLRTNIADIADISASFSNQTPNFYTLGQERGSGTNSYKYTLNNKINLNKFLPGSWGFNIPLKVDYSFSESKPRFQPNSDVELTSEAEKDSLKTLVETKTASVNFSKSKKSSNPFVKYLIDNLKLSARASNKVSLSPTRKDTSNEYSGSANYNLNFSRNNSIGVFKDFKLYYLPQKISLKLDYNYSHSNTWEKQSGENTDFVDKSLIPDEKLKPFFKIDYEIFSDFKTDYSLGTIRDLQKRNQVKNINIGVESNKNQKINVRYAPGYLKFISFSTKYSTDYGQIRGEKSDTPLIEYQVSNNRSFDAGLTLRFDKWGKDLMKAARLLSYSEKEDDGGEKNNEKIEEKEEGAKNNLLDETEIKIGELEDEGELDSLEIPKEENKKEADKITPFKRIASISGQVIGFGIKSLGSTKLSYSNKYNTKYDVPGDSLPDFNYQIGITDLNYGDLKSINQTDNISISTSNRFNILPTLNADVKVNYKQTFANKYTSKSNSNSLTFPDVALTYSGLDNIIPWDLVSNSSVSGGVNRNVTRTGPTPPSKTDKITITSSFSLPINILKTLSPKLSGSYSHTYDKNSNTKIENKNDKLNLSAGIKYSFQSEKGVKFPLFNRIKIKNKLDTNLDISYDSKVSQDYVLSSKKWNVPTGTNTLTIESRASYSFSRDINGGLTAQYKDTKDVKSGNSTRTTSLNLWVEFKF